MSLIQHNLGTHKQTAVGVPLMAGCVSPRDPDADMRRGALRPRLGELQRTVHLARRPAAETPLRLRSGSRVE